MQDDRRLIRVLDWLSDPPIRVGLWLLDRVTGPYPETEADRIRERARSGGAGHSRMSTLMAPPLSDDQTLKLPMVAA